MSQVYSACDLVVSRAGALAITELCYMAKAMILIPFRFAADNHQKLNAEEILINDACVMIEEKDLKKGRLEKTISNLTNDQKKIKTLENAAKRISYDNSNTEITKHINGVINA